MGLFQFVQRFHFVHHTKTIDQVVTILRHGLFRVHSDRRLLPILLEGLEFETEPQAFGQISFSRRRGSVLFTGPTRYGSFGVGVSDEWAANNGIQPVLYIPETGNVTHTLQQLFRAAWADLEQKRREREGADPLTAGGIHNLPSAQIAGAVEGAWLLAYLMRLYEYMQLVVTDADFEDREWRIILDKPFPFNATDSAGQLEEAFGDASTWRIRSVPLEREDLTFLLCPLKARRRLRRAIPPEFRRVPVYSFLGRHPV